jgi:hypothetical protein
MTFGMDLSPPDQQIDLDADGALLAGATRSEEPSAEPAAGETRRAARWWRSRWALAAAVGILLVAVTGVALVSTLRSSDRTRTQLGEATAADAETQADLDHASRDLVDQRAQLQTVLAKATAAGDELEAQTGKRDGVASDVENVHSELTTLNGLLNSQKAGIYFQAQLLADLADCVNRANQALSLLSGGNLDAGTKVLQDSSTKCQAVNDYLASRGVTP